MSKNSKAKRDKKKIVSTRKILASAATKINFDNPKVVQRELNALFKPTRLTTPQEINDDITSFCATIGPSAAFFIAAQPEPWSRQACCDRNVKEYINLHGGEIVCGYRIWYNEPVYIEAERHAVWHNKGVFKDVSFSPDGEKRFLFVADQLDRQGALTDNSARIRWGKDHDTRKLIEIQEEMESRLNPGKMSDDLAWRTMPSYEEWQNGKRVPALVPMSLSSANF